VGNVAHRRKKAPKPVVRRLDEVLNISTAARQTAL
jgi:hypothetical protein